MSLHANALERPYMRAAACVAAWLVFAGAYLALAGTIDSVEIGAGLVCASAATALWLGLRRVAERRFHLAIPARAVLTPLAAILPELATVGRELVAVALRRSPGHQGGFVTQPFDPGSDDARSTGRRALTVLGVSLAPRTFVVRGETSDRLLLHGLPPKPPSPNHAWPAGN